jgi:hypothetical protein
MATSFSVHPTTKPITVVHHKEVRSLFYLGYCHYHVLASHAIMFDLVSAHTALSTLLLIWGIMLRLSHHGLVWTAEVVDITGQYSKRTEYITMNVVVVGPLLRVLRCFYFWV